MKGFIFFIMAIIFKMNISLCQTPSWAWAKSAGGNGEDKAQSIAVDVLGNIYVSGQFTSSSITFGTTTLANSGYSGSNEIFLVKYDANGNVLWAKSAGGNVNGFVTCVTTDSNGNIYVTGYFYSGSTSDSLTFGSITLYYTGGWNTFLVKYTTEGNALWAKSSGGGSVDESNSLAVDDSDNVYMAGNFTSDFLTFDSNILSNSPGNCFYNCSDIFFVKYDSNGNVIWAKSEGGANSEYANSIATDASGNIIITGKYYSDSLTLGSTTLINSDNSSNSTDIFIVKCNSEGNILWAKSAGGPGADYGNSIDTDASENIIATGTFQSDSIMFGGTVLANSDNSGSSSDLFLVKYSSAGMILWAKSYGGGGITVPTWFYNEEANSVKADISGNIYVAGQFFSDSLKFGSTILINNNNTSLTNDLFLAKFDDAGNSVWAKSTGGINDDIAQSVTADATGGIYLAGHFNSPDIDFDFSSVNSNWENDMFLAKISKCGSPAIISICLVSVDTATSSKNFIAWEKPAGISIDNFRIYRQISSQYQFIGSVPYSSLSEFVDTTNGINPKLTSYKYKISMVDTCGDEGPLSDYHQSMHFLVSPANPTGYNLFWNDYIGFSFNQYYIWRDGYNMNDWQILDSVSFGITTYSDPFPPSDSARYWIEAINPAGCILTKSAENHNSSRSNKSTSIAIAGGIEKLSKSDFTTIIPNPNSGIFTVNFPGSVIENRSSLKIYNVLGKIVYTSVITSNSTSLDLSKSGKGIYLMQIRMGEKIYNQKIIVE